MNHDDIRKLAAKASRTARATIQTAKTAQPAKHAEPGKVAKPAAVAQPAPTGRLTLRVVSSRPVPPLKSKPKPPAPAQAELTPAPKPGRFVIPLGTAARVRARAAEQMRQRAAPLPTAAEVDIFKPYQPAPGVLPEGHQPAKFAMDSAVPAISAVAWAGQNYVSAGWFQGMAFLGYPVLAEMSQRPEYRKMSERLATEMVRKWIRLTSTGDDPNTTERIKKINERLIELKLREACGELAMKDGFFGRAHLYLDTGDTDDPAELLKPIGNGRNEISKGKVSPKKPLERLTTVEASWCYPASYNAADPLKPNWLRPQTWFAMGKEVHRSRLLPFIGREVPDLMKPAYAFGGLSLTQMAQPYVDNWISTRDHINRLIANFSKNGIKTDMQQQLSPDGSANDGTDLFSRIDLYTALSDNNGLMVLNKETEEFFQFNTPLGTLDALQSQAMEQMCLPSGMPVVIFFGQTPQGLNASSDGELRTYEQWVEAYQKHFYGDKIQRVIDFVQLSEFGNVDPSIGYQWEPLHSLTEKELAEVGKIKTDTAVAYIGAGVIDPIEVRRNLKADPSSGYNGIDAEDVPEGPDETEGEPEEAGNEEDATAAAESPNPDAKEGGA